MEVNKMSDKDYMEANAFVDWLVAVINKIKDTYSEPRCDSSVFA